MDTQFLKTFVAVVDHGSMASAARTLNITPAAVAQQIRTLERQMGAALIARAGRTVSVTEAGARILERARNLLRDAEDLRAVANDEGAAGELRLGAGTTALTGVLPDILARLVARFAGERVHQAWLFRRSLSRRRKRRAGCGGRARSAVRAAQGVRLAVAARGAAGRARPAEHGGSRSARK